MDESVSLVSGVAIVARRKCDTALGPAKAHAPASIPSGTAAQQPLLLMTHQITIARCRTVVVVGYAHYHARCGCLSFGSSASEIWSLIVASDPPRALSWKTSMPCALFRESLDISATRKWSLFVAPGPLQRTAPAEL